MSVKKIFLSFDYDNDDELRHTFLGQAKVHSKHEIVDQSIPYAASEGWREKAQSKIGNSDMVIFICGVYTDSAKGVEAEMTITRKLGRHYFLLKGRRKHPCSKPKGARACDELQPWKWEHINKLLDKRFQT